MIALGLNLVSCILSLASCAFFIIGAIGYSVLKSQIKEISWIWASRNGVKIYVGLQKVFTEAGGFNGDLYFGSDACTANFCDTCNTTGRDALALLIVAAVFAFFSFVFSVTGSALPIFSVQISNFVMSLISCVFGIIAFSMFMNRCFREIDQAVDEDLHYGPGAIVVLVGFLSMFVVMVLQISASTVVSKTPEQATYVVAATTAPPPAA